MSDFLSSFQQDFIEKDRYLYLLRGLGNTLQYFWVLWLDF